MTLTVTHAYNSTVAPGPTDGLPGGKVGPNEWNAIHVVSGSISGSINVISVKDFGALGDNSGTLVTEDDIQQTGLIGVYDYLCTKDTMGVQEAIFAAFAPLSTPAPLNAICVRSGGASRISNFDRGSYLVAGLVNGVTDNNPFACEFSGHSAATIFIQFDFREGPVVVTEATWYQNASDTHGTWQWQGSNDQVTWTNLGSTFTLGGSSPQVIPITNSTPYRSYRLQGVSGTTSENPILEQIEFKQDGAYVTGNRWGNIVWNGPNGTPNLNKQLFIPNGDFIINRTLNLVAQGFEIEGQSKNSSYLHWQGDAFSAMLLCDSIAYGQIRKLGLTADSPGALSIPEPLWDIDGSSQWNGLHTQQLTIYDCVFNGANNADWLVSISRSGNTAQGDTILFINCDWFNCYNRALYIGGQNALSIQIMNGDFQFCKKDSIVVAGGSVFCYGCSFQNEKLDLDTFGPHANQVRNGGADLKIVSGAGGTTINKIQDIRSESDVGVLNYGGICNVESSGLAGASSFDWFSDFPYLVGTLITPTTNNAKNRTFMCVSNGGLSDDYPRGFHAFDTDGRSTETVLSDHTQSWTVNQWAGKKFMFMFSNSFIDTSATILSNTATTLTIDNAIIDPANNAASYSIAGFTGDTAPNFDGLATGHYNPGSVSGLGDYTTVAGSNSVNCAAIDIGDDLETGDTFDGAMVFPDADIYGISDSSQTSHPQIITGLIALAVADLGSNNIQMNRSAGRSVGPGSGNGFLWGHTLADADAKWLHVPFPSFMGANLTRISQAGNGIVYKAGRLTKVATDPTQLAAPDNQSNDWSPDNGTFDLIDNRQYTIMGAFTAGSSPHDVTGSLTFSGDLQWTPDKDMTLTVTPEPISANISVTRTIRFIFKTSGTTSYTITFGTGFAPSATVVTGTADAKIWTVTFQLVGSKYVEVGRSGPL